MDQENRLSYFFLGLGLGVAVGVLFAPKAGAETRELIRNKAEESGEYVRRRGNELRDSATGAIDRSKEELNRRKDHLTAAVDAGKQAYREATAAVDGE